ncbi:MAG: arsenate reductase ArsC [Deltaproteobacteria bacterium]|nr:arsenate reductase ArsC [Deltaproteobacteria bacterium]
MTSEKRARGVLFVCVANAARSQMAEGWGRKLLPPEVAVWSAGSRPARVSRDAIAVMNEVGIDIAGHWSKSIADVPLEQIDLIVALCAEEECPVVPRPIARESWALPDPGAVMGSAEERLNAFRATRDEIRRRVEGLARRR